MMLENQYFVEHLAEHLAEHLVAEKQEKQEKPNNKNNHSLFLSVNRYEIMVRTSIFLLSKADHY